MPCYHPILAYRSKDVNPGTGRRSLVFNPRLAYSDLTVTIPCGQCIGCRLSHSRDWAVRCVHEASLYPDNCFITLTFNDGHLNPTGTLVKRDFQLFMKRLRKKFPVDPPGIRYYHCGEYGDLLKRPHHHACLFNFDFPDKVLHSRKGGINLYRSAALEKLWTFGYSTIGQVTFDSAAYVARYILKKQTGKSSSSYYKALLPPYTTMSRKPGIAKQWFDQFKTDVYPSDLVVMRNNLKCRPPRYYDTLYDVINPAAMLVLKNKRIRAAKNNLDGSAERLVVKEQCAKARLKQLKRGLHDS